MKEHFILAVMWILYCVLHSVLAHIKIKEGARNIFGKWFRYYRIMYVIFSFAGLIFLLWYHITIPSIVVFDQNRFAVLSGSFIGLCGLILMLVCIRKYFMNLSGLKSLLYNQEKGQLMITGVHKYVRHPLYLGTFAFIWGLFLLMPVFSLLLVNTIITVYTLIGIYLEEDKLLAEFGKDYEIYRRNVPGLWPSFRSKRNLKKPNG